MRRKNEYKIKTHNLIFVYLVTTIIVTAISLSKYYTAISGNDNTKVAIYAMNVSSQDNKDLKVDVAGENNLILADSCSYVITNAVDNKITEVAVAYKIKVEFEDELPVGITIGVKDEDGRDGVATITGNSYIFENNAWKFTPDSIQQNIITITFTGENIESATSSMIENVQVSAIVEQID